MADSFTAGHALIVGVANYRTASKLPQAVLDDAKDMASLLTSPDHCGYPAHQVRLLLDDQADAAAIRSELTDLAKRAGPNDTAVVYFSGHGGTLTNDPEPGTYLLSVDFDRAQPQKTSLIANEFTQLVASIKAQRVLVLLDACHAAGIGDLKDEAVPAGPDIKPGLDDKTYLDLAQGAGRVIIASCRANETSLVMHGEKNSLFTTYLLDVLRGNAGQSTNGFIRVLDVFEHVSNLVPAKSGNKQHPILKVQEMDNNYPVAAFRGGKAASDSGQPALPQRKLAPTTLDGKTRIILTGRLVDRWRPLAMYFDMTQAEQAQLIPGHEPKGILDWLEQRGKLRELREAFNFLGYDDLLEQIPTHP